MGSNSDVKCITLIWHNVKLKHARLNANGWNVPIALDESNDGCSSIYEPNDVVKIVLIIAVKWDIDRY